MTEPSPEDYEVTEGLQEACRYLNIDLLDHYIVGKEDVQSLANTANLDYETKYAEWEEKQVKKEQRKEKRKTKATIER